MKTILRALMLILFVWTHITATASAEDASASKISSEQQQALVEINQALQDNPELILGLRQSLNAFLQQRAEHNNALLNSEAWLYQQTLHPRLGDENAPHKIIVFTDYDCPFCKRLEPVLEKLVAEQPNIQVISILVPLRQNLPAGATTNSALFALDVWQHNPTQFSQAHDLLMKKSGLHTAASLKHIAEATGNERFLKASAHSLQTVERNAGVFNSLGLRGTPAIMVGRQVLPGFVPFAQLLETAQAEFKLE